MDRFCIQGQLEFGKCYYVVHSLNEWSLDDSIKLSWSKGHKWTGNLNTLADYQFKYVIANYLNPNFETIWERGLNRNKKSFTDINEDEWEKRSVCMKLKLSRNLKGAVVITGDCTSLQHSKTMEYYSHKKTFSKLRTSLSLSVDEIERGFNYQYHIFNIDKRGDLTEFIGKQQNSKKISQSKEKENIIQFHPLSGNQLKPNQ